MEFQEFKNKTEKFLIINKSILRNFEPNEKTLIGNIRYWIKKGEIIPLKNGVYLRKDIYENESEKDLYLEYIANQLIQPSYVSMEYVLSKYQIFSEPVNAITSMTLKTPRELINPLGAFRYYSLSENLFKGYKIKNLSSYPIWEAEKSKALFDYLYIRFFKNNPVNETAIKNLRLNWENISKKDFIKANSFTSLTRSKRIECVFNIIGKMYY